MEAVTVREEIVAVIVGEFLADLEPLPDTEVEALSVIGLAEAETDEVAEGLGAAVADGAADQDKLAEIEGEPLTALESEGSAVSEAVSDFD